MPIMNDRQKRGFSELENGIKILIRRSGFSLSFLIMPSIVSLVAALFEAISIGALIPMVNGIINRDFSFIKSKLVFVVTAKVFPALTEAQNTTLFVVLLSVVFVFAVASQVLSYFSSILVSSQLRKFSNEMRKIIFGRYLSFGKLFFDRSNEGNLYNILINYTNHITGQLKERSSLIHNFLLLTAYIAILFSIYWKLTFWVIAIFPALYFSSNWLLKKITHTSTLYSGSYKQLSSKISNTLSCIPLVKLYGSEKREREHFALMSHDIERFEFSMDKKYYLLRPLQEIILLTSVLLLVSAVAFIVVKQKFIQIGGFFVYFYVLKRAQVAFSSLNFSRASLAQVKGPIDEILNILDDKGKFFVTGGKILFPGLKRRIEVRNLNFSYGSERLVLKDLSFSIEKGKISAIVGPTGAGKSTLINLLLRFYDCPPRSIFVDGNDIRDFELSSLRTHFALVSQDTLLFNDTIKNNIIYGLKDNIPEEKIIDVLNKARLYNFVFELPKKLDTYIGDRGIRLSGGEKQRLAIARALIKDAEILVLDEATSSLDSKTERLIQEAIAEAVRGRTTIVIAHRLSTIKSSDKIIVIEEGGLAEEGALEELLSRKGKFYSYWQEQKFS